MTGSESERLSADETLREIARTPCHVFIVEGRDICPHCLAEAVLAEVRDAI
jgi:hypothetical protein